MKNSPLNLEKSILLTQTFNSKAKNINSKINFQLGNLGAFNFQLKKQRQLLQQRHCLTRWGWCLGVGAPWHQTRGEVVAHGGRELWMVKNGGVCGCDMLGSIPSHTRVKIPKFQKET